MKLDALQSPRYRRFWLGSIFSTGATQLYFVGMGWLVFKLTGSALYLGLLGVAMAVPTILATLAGGLVADHGNRGRILLITSILAGLALGILTILDLGDWVTVWQVLLLAALLGSISGFDLPARVSFFPALIEPHQMMSAVALNSILWQGTRMVLPAVGGVLIALADTWIIFALCTIGFAVMAKILLSLQTPDAFPKHSDHNRGLTAAWRFILQEKLFAVLIAMTWISMFFGTAYVQIMPVFAELLGTGEEGYGLLLSATGVGSVLGTILVGRLQNSPRLGSVMMGGSVFFCLSLILFALVTGIAADWHFAFALACGCAMLSAVGGSFFLISSMTVMQLAVPDALRGRVMGIHSITFSLIALGGLVLGPLAELFSAPSALLIGVGVVLASIVGFSIKFDRLWRLNGQDQQLHL
ncbi:MAG TPA: MFS transporter [Gammaproteobacteria bacterium]|jgi:MFS family permease|nr:MFS transporter [Gammaproteobacteria bacterium]HCL94353.1 MFS transporter [Gammaproteobacteria bacterium]|tara:strand:- start:1670 stop:2908 length:1239 start_codon:yes stop_codon:yes gene_type:complete